MKRYQAIIIAAAAVVGSFYVGATYAASTDDVVELRCGIETAILAGNSLHWRDRTYLEPAGGSDTMTFVLPGSPVVILKIAPPFIFLSQGNTTVSCEYVG